jgi:hypothetical protein
MKRKYVTRFFIIKSLSLKILYPFSLRRNERDGNRKFKKAFTKFLKSTRTVTKATVLDFVGYRS